MLPVIVLSIPNNENAGESEEVPSCPEGCVMPKDKPG